MERFFFSPLLLLVLVMSVVTLLVYRHDKMRAQAQGWRVPELHLHLLSLLGGWPGALVAQRRYRHKTRKGSFQVMFWLTVLLNCASLYALARAFPTALLLR